MKFLSAFLLLFFSLFQSVYAKDTQIVFWYPGEAGSQSEAQPILDAFSEIASQRAPTKLTAVYFNDSAAGENFIRKNKPQLGILSYATWLQWQKTHPESKVLLQVLPQHGKTTEQYLLLGKNPPHGKITILSSEPLSNNYITAQLFPNSAWQAEVSSSSQLLFKLKELAEGKWNGYCLLSPREAQSFNALKSPWKQNLQFSQSSQAVPTARLVNLQGNLPNEEKWRQVFLELKKQPDASAMLEELSLSGFAQ